MDISRRYLAITPVVAPVDGWVAMAIQQLQQKDSKMSDCIDNCFEASQAAELCADACIEEGSEEMARCIQLCRDVADLTSLHARFMSRSSDYHAELASICADACEACAEECSQFDMEHCQTCAEVLEPCAESCQSMAA